jgi:hypothetical protein
MSRCLPAVRSFVRDGGDSVDWLFEQASNDADVVLLYSLRMCFFFHDREEVDAYKMNELFEKVTGHVPSFSDTEFALLSEAVKLEIASGRAMEELFNPAPPESLLSQLETVVSVPILGMVIGLGIIPLYMWSKRRVINRTKQD